MFDIVNDLLMLYIISLIFIDIFNVVWHISMNKITAVDQCTLYNVDVTQCTTIIIVRLWQIPADQSPSERNVNLFQNIHIPSKGKLQYSWLLLCYRSQISLAVRPCGLLTCRISYSICFASPTYHYLPASIYGKLGI